MSVASFLWHDYETFGTHPALDRPAQFAALRTDADLEPLGEPLTWYCRPADDVLPHPGACLVTGITPQEAARRGVIETEFARLIHAEMVEPGTCSAGYNSLRFDDEFSRHLFYRNFFEPYGREYRNGNSRWDLIDLARMCYALRPGGINWPEHKPGQPSFRLEDLTAANDIEHSDAHDALADVRATIALARLIRHHQPRLYDWSLGLRRQPQAMALLDTAKPTPVLHTSARIPAARGCTTLVLPLAIMPGRAKSVIAVDLMAEPDALLELAAEDLADRVFTPVADLPEEVDRVPLKAIHSNKVPMLAPRGTLKGVDLDRIGLDPERCMRHAHSLVKALPQVREKVMRVFVRPPSEPSDDPDLALYSGGFFSARDRRTMDRVRASPPDQLGRRNWDFEDARLPEMLFRYRARNFSDSLSVEENTRWERDRRRRLLDPGIPGRLDLATFRTSLEAARQAHSGSETRLAILDQLAAWPLELRLEN